MLHECIYGECAHSKENPNPNSHDRFLLSKWKCREVSSFLTAHQHILGYSVPFIHSVLLLVW